MITAGVIGIVSRFRYILVTKSLLSNLSPEELDSVIAHEAAHIKKRHLLYYLLFLAGFMLVAFPSLDIVAYLMLFSKHTYFWVAATGLSPSAAVPFLHSAVLVVSFLLYFRYIFGYFMRNFERQADAYAFSMSGAASPLVTTFKKIAFTSGQSPDKPSWHHFSLSQRIDFLSRLEKDKSLLSRHDRRVFLSIVLFAVSLITVGIFGYHANFGDAGKNLRAHLLQSMQKRGEENLLLEIKENPENLELRTLLGDLYYSRNNFEGAIDAYETVLSLNFDTPHVLNNLAWLYVTCENLSLQNPERALILSRRAAELNPSPETLDTLGESYYVNGEYEEAMEVEMIAIEMSLKNRQYYEEQLRKFEAAFNE
jgi:tetratricopeptide (TPR) repeat protein